jgi:hypothetical protein
MIKEIPMMDENRIREHCLAEVEARRRWADEVTDEWRARASAVSLEMLDEALNLPIDEQADRLLSYWKLRYGAQQEGRYIDLNARRQWDAVIDGRPIEGNYSYWQNSHPAPAAGSSMTR